MVLFFVALIAPKKAVVSSFSGGPKISIIIVFRNEEQHLKQLLNSIQKQAYTNFEVLLVNDSSTDSSVAVVQEFIENSTINVRLFHAESPTKAPKKQGIELALKNATGTYIAQTDADCIVPENWLEQFLPYVETNDLVAGAVLISQQSTERSSVLGSYQKLDFLSLQLVTQAMFRLKQPIMANGANIMYSKQAYLNHYQPNELASGDDVFLLNALSNAGCKVAYCPENIVETQPVESWRHVFNQRVRWASKTGKNPNKFNLLVGVVMLLVNMSFLGLLFQAAKLEPLALVILISKILVDARALIFMQEYHRVYTKGWHLLLALLINPVITVSVFLAGFKRNYTWKNRVFSS